jgi:lipoyl(octanoyl) transferase
VDTDFLRENVNGNKIRVHQCKSEEKNLISVLQLGTVDYATGLRLQERLVALRKEGRIGDTLLLLEHTPVITLGRNAKQSNIVAAPELLAQRGVEVLECDRGGDVTFHGPGQLVAYPIFDLRGFLSSSENRKTMGVIEFVRNLEEVLIRSCAEFRIPTKRIAGLTGVWTEGAVAQELTESSTQPDGQRRPSPHSSFEPTSSEHEAKIAALGIHISRGVTSHGIALNVNADLSFFNLIIPCGITAKPVTSMQKELGREISMQDVAHALSRNLGVVFSSQILWLESLDALLGNNLGVPMQPPENLRKLHGAEGPILA